MTLIGVFMIGELNNIQPQTFPFTNNFKVKEGVCGLRSHFYIQNSEGEELGTSLRPFATLTDTYVLKNLEEQTIAEGTVTLFSLRKTIEFSANGDPMGSMTKKICSFFKEYTILDNDKNTIGEVKGNWLSTRFTISDPQTKRIMAVFSRPVFQCCGSKWKVNISPINTIDTRILSMLPMFITSEINSDSRRSIKYD